jgi:hypothetical protein
MAQNQKDGQSLAVLYQVLVKKVECECEYIFNSTGKNDIYVEVEENRKYEIYDILGNKYSSGEIAKGISKLPIKNCEMVKIIKPIF